MNHDPYDDLDRLLFALPLEEPPKGMRANILASTVYRPAFPIKIWETWVLGSLIALAVWLSVLIWQGGGPAFAGTLSLLGQVFSRGLFAESTLLWLAIGGGVAFVLLILNL
ncbi:MAG: hypothetical protein M3126_08465, partial [Candidatus Eremiobacteraeota bacterium]|nr:hypothetical protein [Candidatus Eremiobacteraeota bacterium]